MKKKIKADINGLEFYDFYKEKYPESNIDSKTFILIIKTFFDKIIKNLIYTGSDFYMPYRLGSLRIKKSKLKIRLNKDGTLDKRKLIPNWKATKELWGKIYPNKTLNEIKEIKNKPIVYHENEHTDGYLYKWHWDKITCMTKNAVAYKLDITRTNDRLLAKISKSKNKPDYSLY